MTATVNATTNVTDNTIQTCLSTSQQNVEFCCLPQTGACPPGISSNCTYSDINVSQGTAINTSCVQNATSNTTVTQQVTQNIQQTAEAITASFGLNETDASNVATATQNVQDSIMNNFNNTLETGGDSNIGFYGGGCQNNYTYINADQFAQWAQSGVQDTATVTSSTQALSQTISQKATAVDLGLLGLLIGIALVIIALGYGGYKLTSGGLKAALPILLLILVVFGGYIGAAAYFRWPPWKWKAPNQGSGCSNMGSAAPPCTNGQVCGDSGNGTFCVGQCYSGAACLSNNCVSSVPYTYADGTQVTIQGVCACGGGANGTGCASPYTRCFASGDLPVGPNSGYCMPAKACTTNSDCNTSVNGETCSNDICTPQTCTYNSDCLGGWVCNSGACIPPCTTNANCSSSSTCQQLSGANPPPGMYCVPSSSALLRAPPPVNCSN